MLYTHCIDTFADGDPDVLENYSSDAEATAAFQPSFDDEIIGWEDYEFGDCWVKFHTSPPGLVDGIAVVDGIECDVREPGTHPGGRAWWCTPVLAVKVPVFAQETDDVK